MDSGFWILDSVYSTVFSEKNLAAIPSFLLVFAWSGRVISGMVYSQFQELPVWKDSIEVAADVFKICREGPVQHEFRLKDQLTSACTSISSNIAEGFEYHNNRQFIRYLTYAKGSASETISLLHVMYRSDYISEDDFKKFTTKLMSLASQIGGFIKYLERNPGS